MNYDLILKNGRIVDGTGNPWYKANIGVKNGKIHTISRRDLENAERLIDVEGLAVSPGFINPHGHIGRRLHEDNAVLQSVKQGLTMECTGNCGKAVHTMSEEHKRYRQNKSNSTIDWRTLEEWRKKMEGIGIGLNIAPFLGLSTIRTSVMGQEGEGGERFKPSQEELNQMKALVEEGMNDGAFGITVGLSYVVQRNATTEEIIALTKVVAKYGGVFMAHPRGGANSTLEFVEICEKTPIPGCLSHTAIAAAREYDAQFHNARERGVEILFDLYPWIHASNGKGLGYWLFTNPWGGKPDPRAQRFVNIKNFDDPFFEETAEQLKNDAEWKKVKAAAMEAMERSKKLIEENNERRKVLEASGTNLRALPIKDPSWRVGIVYSPSHPEFEGDDIKMPADLTEVAEALGCTDFWDAARELFIADKGRTLTINLARTAAPNRQPKRRDKDVIASYQMPEAIVCSDCGSGFSTHPRNWGSWPKILQRYVRELNVLRLEEAIKKMTSLPAQFLGLTDRGLIKTGMWADITVFDPKRVTNKATYRNPRQYPNGIPYVICNGKVVIDEENFTGVLPGKVLRRP